MAYLLPSEHDVYLLLLINVSLVAVYLRHHRHDHLSFRPVRPLLDLEDAVGPSIFVLVSSGYGFPSDNNTVESIVGDVPFFWQVSSVSFGTGTFLQVCSLLTIFHDCCCFFACQVL